MRLLFLLAVAAFALPEAAHAQDVVLVQHVSSVALARAGGALLVTAGGTVPIAGFTNPALKPRPDLVKVAGGYVLDFVATPPRGASVAQVETSIVVTLRIEPAEAETLRFVQVRGALGSRTVQVPKAK
ncbi:MAG TPA: hypothetical protein VIF14_03950 [Alphaproteobacteria bacterium]|jgi:hypothetical protein